MNVITVVGTLGRDPELRYTSGGLAYAKFSVASNDYYKGEKKVTWFNMVAWGKNAENIQKYLDKGSQAVFVGKIQASTWEKDGKKQYSMEVVVDRVHFIGSRTDNSREEEADIPF